MPNKPILQSYIQYKYSLTAMAIFGTIEITGSGATDDQYVDNTDTDGSTTETDYYMWIVPQQPLTSAITVTITGTDESDAPATSDAMAIAANTQKNLGTLVLVSALGDTWHNVTSVDVDNTLHGAAGDQLDLIGLPKPTSTSWVNLNFVQSSDITPGPSLESVPNRMEPQFVSIRIREGNAFTMQSRYVTNNDTNSIAKLRGREVCLMQVVHENGGAAIKEYIMLGNAIMNDVPLSMPDNAAATISVSGNFRRMVMYTPS